MAQQPGEPPAASCRILTLDGGGAKGFYTLGVLNDIEAMVGPPLVERFQIIFGTSTGAIIAALIALGRPVREIHELYKCYVPRIMRARCPAEKSKALQAAGEQIFRDRTFDDLPVHLGIVAAHWHLQAPMIFKTSVAQAYGRKATFAPGFGCTLADAVQASCSAYPFFKRKLVTTSQHEAIELLDGGYAANNPTLYALADALVALRYERDAIRVLSVGVGDFPHPITRGLRGLAKRVMSRTMHTLGLDIDLLQKTMDINARSMDTLRTILFNDIHTVRISDAFTDPELATDFLEHNVDKLELLYIRGRESFGTHEPALHAFFA